jgi:beta-glucanase (GH16 family)
MTQYTSSGTIKLNPELNNEIPAKGSPLFCAQDSWAQGRFTVNWGAPDLMRSVALFSGLLTILTAGIWAQSRQFPVFSDDFKGGILDTSKWNVATYRSPDSKPGINIGQYSQDAIDFTQGMLRITVQQREVDGVVQSTGGAIISKERFGFGTYKFEMRMSSTSPTPEGDGKALTGAISSGFVYRHKSESEIDLEFLGNENAIWISSWRNSNPSADPTWFDKISDKVFDDSLATRFRHYKLIWTPQAVDVYIDGTQVAHQTEHIPQTPAHIILQHRGTNRNKWGGVATVGVDRYFFVRSVNFTPLRDGQN